MIVPRVVAAVDGIVPTGAEADEYVRTAPGGRLELAEVLSAAAGSLGIGLPRTDAELVPILRKYGRATSTFRWAVVGVLPDGRTALGTGGPTAVESLGDVVGIVTDPGAGRYVELWEIPGVIYLGGKK